MWIRTVHAGPGVGYIQAEHDWLEELVSEKHVQRGDVVIDVGGHVGIFTRKALDRGAAKVIAIEPDPNSIECLRRNFPAEIASGQVVVVPLGAWHETGTMNLSLGAAPGWNSMVNKISENSIDVPVRKLDDIVAELGIKTISFIKMDIEGAESQALQGAQGILSKHHPTVMIDSYTWPENLTPLDKILQNTNSTYDRASGPCEPSRAQDMVVPHVVSYNTSDGRI